MDTKKLICYHHPKRNKTLDEWDLKVVPVDMETTSHLIKFNGKEIVLNTTGKYLRVDSEKAGLPEVTGFVECEFFDTEWRMLGFFGGSV